MENMVHEDEQIAELPFDFFFYLKLAASWIYCSEGFHFYVKLIYILAALKQNFAC